MLRLTPVYIPDTTMKHIHSNHEKHITRQDLREVLNRPQKELEVAASSGKHKSDLEIHGRTLDGKLLHVCVIINKEKRKEAFAQINKSVSPEYYGSIVYNAWQVRG